MQTFFTYILVLKYVVMLLCVCCLVAVLMFIGQLCEREPDPRRGGDALVCVLHAEYFYRFFFDFVCVENVTLIRWLLNQR